MPLGLAHAVRSQAHHKPSSAERANIAAAIAMIEIGRKQSHEMIISPSTAMGSKASTESIVAANWVTRMALEASEHLDTPASPSFAQALVAGFSCMHACR